MNRKFNVTYSDDGEKLVQINSRSAVFKELYETVKSSNRTYQAPIKVNELTNGFTIEIDR